MWLLYLFSAVLASINASVLKMDVQGHARQGRAMSSMVRSHTKVPSSGSSPLQYIGVYYTMSIALGTPPQPLHVFPDTSVSYFQVVGTGCTYELCLHPYYTNYIRTEFNTSASSTYQQIAPNCGDVAALLGSDTINIGSLSQGNQDVCVYNHYKPEMDVLPADGVLGLGFPANNYTTVMQNLIPVLDAPIFSLWFSQQVPTSSLNSGTFGSITFGAVDSNCAESVKYTPLSSSNSWQFPFSGFSIGNRTDNKKIQAILDSGTSWIGCPSNDLGIIISATGAMYDSKNGVYTVPCSKINSLPDLVFTINGDQYPISASLYALDIGLGGGKCALTFFSYQSGGFGPSWIFGDTWFRSYCSVFDYGNQRVGFSSKILP